MDRIIINFFLLLCCSILTIVFGNDLPPPHVILIVADDLGWNDVGFHGSDQIPTPNIDRLAKEGIILNNYYVQPICTPTRSALMTGRYPIHNGMHHGVIHAAEPYGMPLDDKILPEYLKDQGYATHMIGKWHLGHFAKKYTPTYRGFDTFFGYYTGTEDYFQHTSEDRLPSGKVAVGLDLHRNVGDVSEPVWDKQGNYSTYMYTDQAIDIVQNHPKDKPLFMYLPYQNTHAPLQAPQDEIDKFKDIRNSKRRTFAAMVATLDDAIGRVHKVLEKEGMLDNSVIIFTSDNGGSPSKHISNNYPLRGQKTMLFEGGVRVPAFVNSKLLKQSGVTSMDLMHVTDWLPTIVNLAKGSIAKIHDGFDQWTTLQGDEIESPRKEILLNIHRSSRKKKEALIVGKWKLISETIQNDDWIVAPGYNASGKATSVVNCGAKPVSTRRCDQTHCLFDLHQDPCEYNDLSGSYPDVVKVMKDKIEGYRKRMVKPRNKRREEAADPDKHGGVWLPWK